MNTLPYQDKTSPWSSHTLIARQVGTLPPGSKVLDVGAASGMLARREWDRPLRFFGIESQPEWAAMAKPFYETLWTCTLDDAPDQALTGYDAVVLGDILEHLPAPESTLVKLVSLQPSGCLFLISVPNVANLWVRLQLLIGRFDYAERGILDRTHLRFFTRKTAVEMTERAGLKIRSIQTTPIPLELLSPFFVTPLGRTLHACLALITNILPTLLGYQFVVGAERP